MTEKKLDSFKAGAKQPPSARPRGKAAGDDKGSEPSQTLGFARIEAILDNQTPEAVREQLAGLQASLDTYAAEAASPKDKAGAKRAKLGVERTMELLAYLFATKEQMFAKFIGAAAAAPGGKPGKGGKKMPEAKGAHKPKQSGGK